MDGELVSVTSEEQWDAKPPKRLQVSPQCCSHFPVLLMHASGSLLQEGCTQEFFSFSFLFFFFWGNTVPCLGSSGCMPCNYFAKLSRRKLIIRYSCDLTKLPKELCKLALLETNRIHVKIRDYDSDPCQTKQSRNDRHVRKWIPPLSILFCDADLTFHTIREKAGYAKHKAITSVSFVSQFRKRLCQKPPAGVGISNDLGLNSASKNVLRTHL